MSLRDTIEDAVNTAELTPDPVTPAAPVETPIVTPQAASVEETAEQKAGRTAGRSRDEHGRLLPGKADKPPVQVAVQAAPIVQQAPKMPPPSSWKKDHWGAWEKLSTENPQLAEYLNQREGEFAKGVSTYKQEYESVRPLQEAIAPLLPILQQYGIPPAQWITNMGNAHHQLVFGTPQQKLQMFTKLAQDYQVPLQALYDPQVQQQYLMQQQLQPPAPPQDVRKIVQEQLTELFAKQDLEQFRSSKDASGNPLYPHYDKLRDDMALLIEHGKAQDLKSAYDIAIRLHDDIWTEQQAAKQAAAQKSAQQGQQRQVAQAKAAAVSPKTATPGAEGAKKPTGIRSAIEASFDAVAQEGRV